MEIFEGIADDDLDEIGRRIGRTAAMLAVPLIDFVARLEENRGDLLSKARESGIADTAAAACIDYVDGIALREFARCAGASGQSAGGAH